MLNTPSFPLKLKLNQEYKLLTIYNWQVLTNSSNSFRIHGPARFFPARNVLLRKTSHTSIFIVFFFFCWTAKKLSLRCLYFDFSFLFFSTKYHNIWIRKSVIFGCVQTLIIYRLRIRFSKLNTYSDKSEDDRNRFTPRGTRVIPIKRVLRIIIFWTKNIEKFTYSAPRMGHCSKWEVEMVKCIGELSWYL